MSEFPTLAGHVPLLPRCNSQDSLTNNSTNYYFAPSSHGVNTGHKDETLRADTEQQQFMQADSLHYDPEMASNFAIQSEDFPALPGSHTTSLNPLRHNNDVCQAALPHAGVVASMYGPAASPVLERGQTDDRKQSSSYATHKSHSKPTLVFGSQSVGSSILGGCNLSTDPPGDREHYNASLLLDTPKAHSHASTPPSSYETDLGVTTQMPRVAPKYAKGRTQVESQTKFGLLGLLDVIRMTNADLNTLALGSDLTTLGLNLNSSECLYSTFASPWAEAPTTREPQFSLPLCYYMQPPPLKTSHLSKFQLETLFYIFYAMPKDVLQAYAAQELYNREWQYHQDLKLWFKRGSSTDGLSVPETQYIYFDIESWECCVFPNVHLAGNLTAGLLHEDAVRVKFMTSP